MLDAETRARIDSARDILVGKVPDPKSQVEQITIALIYKFMDDKDRQSEEFGGRPSFFTGQLKKYRWSQLLDKRLGGHERLLLYAEGIEKMNENKNIPQLFRDLQRQIVAELEAERKLVDGNRELIARMEKKMQAKLAEIWGEPAEVPA
jgi:hypothetical protein